MAIQALPISKPEGKLTKNQWVRSLNMVGQVCYKLRQTSLLYLGSNT